MQIRIKDTQKMAKKPIIGISTGDINGVGTEVIIKTLSNPLLLETLTPVIFGSSKLISFYKKILDIDLQFNGVDNISNIVPGKINIVNLWKDNLDIEPGKETAEAGKYAFESLQAAVKALSEGKTDALVTGPINKNNIQSADFCFPGHTEYLQEQLGGEALMFLVSDQLKVGVATGHIALDKVAESITPELIVKKVGQIEKSLIRDFGVRRPRIAILGLDPHNGDKGVIGNRDEQIIVPTVKKLFGSGKMVFGPYAADGFFGTGQYRHFDAVLAMYHDQGLVPFKTIAFEDGVNFTAGLPKVRTSPDHGTGYSIAGKGEADESSFRAAVYTALDILKNRAEYAALTANVLVSSKVLSSNVDEDINADDIRS